MNKKLYFQGEQGAKYGIWDTKERSWKHDICEDTPMIAMARLYQHLGSSAKRSGCEARKLPKYKNNAKEVLQCE